MQGKDFALIAALGALGYVLYEWYKSGQPLSNLLPFTTNATGQTIASLNAGGVIIPSYGDYGMGIPTNAVIQPISTTPVYTSTPANPSNIPSPTANFGYWATKNKPTKLSNVTSHGSVTSSDLVSSGVANIDATISQDQALGLQFAATHSVQSLNPFYVEQQNLSNLPGVQTTYPNQVAAINAGALVMNSRGQWIPAIPGAQITY